MDSSCSYSLRLDAIPEVIGAPWGNQEWPEGCTGEPSPTAAMLSAAGEGQKECECLLCLPQVEVGRHMPRLVALQVDTRSLNSFQGTAGAEQQ